MLNKNYPISKKQRLRVIACIQARMGSARLKKKVLLKILDKTLIEHIFNRLQLAQEIDEVVLSTSVKKENDVLVKHAENIGLRYYRGSEEDLVSRLYKTAKKFKADAIVRITGDCPLVDHKLIDKMVKFYRNNYKKFDFFTNVFPPTFPQGLDIEIMPFSTLRKLYLGVKDPLYREWLNCYIMENPKKFRIYNLTNPIHLLPMRWTVDYPEDLAFVRKIFKSLDGKNKIFVMKDVLDFLKKNPAIQKINERRIDNIVIGGIRSAAYHSIVKK